MSWINAVKGAIFEETPGDTTVPAPVAANPSNPSVPTAAPTVDADMVTAIKKTTLARKTAYTALLEAADKLTNVIPDSNTRIKAAYAMVSGEQRTIDTIVNALDIHINDVDSEKARFAQQSKSLHDTDVAAVRTQADTLAATNARLQQQIAELNQQVNANAASIATLAQQADVRQQELDRAAAQFAASAQIVRAEFEQQRATLTTLLS
jgi:chromosome segregation ATPase